MRHQGALDVPQVLATSDATKNLYGLERIGVEQGGTWRYPLPDALGSVRQWTDPAGGVLAVQSYGPFGEPRDPLCHPQVAAGTPPWGRISLAADGVGRAPKGFTGEWQDPAGMVYLRARWHNPALGRFTQVDPVVGPLTVPVTQHPYTYAPNNALRYTDASGRNVPWLIIGAAAVGAAIDYGAQVYHNRQAGLDWGAALTTNIDVREVVSAAGVGGMAAIMLPQAISGVGVGLFGAGVALYGLSQTLAGYSGPIPQYLAFSSYWAASNLGS